MMPIFALLAALCAPGDIRPQDAERLVLAAPDLTAEARAQNSKPIITWTEKTRRGWAFRIGATNPCEPGQDVCSSLVGYYSVDARTLRVTDDALEQDVTSAKLRKLAASLRRDRCEKSAGRR